jgi:uncharacterized membrane protein
MSSDSRGLPGIARTALPLALLLALAVWFRFHEIGRLPLWLDEAYSFWFSGQSFRSLWTFVPTFETHPPVYYSLLRLWRVFGEDETALRSLSAVLGILATAAVYLLGRIVGGRGDGPWIGFGAGLIFAVSPIQVQYAQEARSSMAVTLAVSITICGAAWLMRHPEAACRTLFRPPPPPAGDGGPSTADPSPRWAWLALVGGAAASLWLHNLAPLFVFSVAVAMIAGLAGPLRWNLGFLVNGVLASLTVLLLWLPWVPYLFKQAEAVSSVFWMKAPTLVQTAGAMYFFFGAKYSWPVETYTSGAARLSELDAAGLAGGALWLAAHAGLAALGAIGFWRVGRRHGWQLAILLASVMVLPIALTLLATFTVRPIFATRALIWVAVPFYVMLAAGVAATRRIWPRGVLVAALAALFALGSLNYYATFEKEPWDRIAHLLSTESKPGDIVLVVPNSAELPLAYYLRDRKVDLPIVGLPRPFPAVGLPNPYPAGIAAVPGMTEADVPALRERLDGAASGWLITRAVSLFDPEGLAAAAVGRDKTLSPKGLYARDNIAVYRFE